MSVLALVLRSFNVYFSAKIYPCFKCDLHSKYVNNWDYGA